MNSIIYFKKEKENLDLKKKISELTKCFEVKLIIF
jgi:hypothetical protein